MKKLLAFGDSNTWGLIPGSKSGERYPFEIRWTGVLQNSCSSIRVIEEGLCGRTTAFEDRTRPGRNGAASLPLIFERIDPPDAVVIMLGTNDCKSDYSLSPHLIGKGVESCLDVITAHVPPEKILLVSPILLGENVWRDDKDPDFGFESVSLCRKLKEEYKRIAVEYGTGFLAASDHAAANEADCEHLDAQGHRALAGALGDSLREILGLEQELPVAL